MNKLVKSLLLAAPATLVAAAAAQAADLPANKSAPVSYVKICDAYGQGFFYIPGTDTCLRVGGYNRFETRFTPGQNVYTALATTVPNPTGGAAVAVAAGGISQVAGSQDTTGMEVRGRVDLDARTQTQWGTVQTVVQLRGTNADGMYAQASIGNFGAYYTPVGNKSTSVTMERAYFRFAGLTAGVAAENFTTMPSVMYGPTEYAGFPNGMKQLAYTATFGSGFSATLAIESKGDLGNAGVASNGTGAGAQAAVPYTYGATYNNRFTGEFLVGNVRTDQSWGYVQLSGAVADNSLNATSMAGNYSPLAVATHNASWAAGFSLKYNLPMLAAGDSISAQFTYANGLVGLIHSSGSNNDGSDSSGSYRWLGGIPVFQNPIQATNAVITATGAPCTAASAAGTCTITAVGQTKGLQAFAVLTHYWTPTWRTNVQAGFVQFWAPAAAPGALVQEGNSHYIATGANLIWSPVKNFDIGVELDYAHLSENIQNAPVVYNGAALNNGNWMGTLRIERQF